MGGAGERASPCRGVGCPRKIPFVTSQQGDKPPLAGAWGVSTPFPFFIQGRRRPERGTSRGTKKMKHPCFHPQSPLYYNPSDVQ